MNPFLFQQYDLSSVTSVFTAAAPLSRHLSEKLHQLRPTWKFVHGYGISPFVSNQFTHALTGVGVLF